MGIADIGLGLAVLSLAIWIGLLGFRGQFWRSNQRLADPPKNLERLPVVCAVIPARDEADLLPVTLRSLFTQDYPGSFTIVLVDDGSTDGTAEVAQRIAQELGKIQHLHILCTEPLPPGWTGKLWALQQGIEYAQTLTPSPDYFLLTDADIEHDAVNLRRLVAKAQQEELDLVSLMVQLRCETFWERLLIPAFVFFFQKLYPFPWVNDPTQPTAAAAGGCILITRAALTRIGGIQVVRNALIDDCALAQAVKLGRNKAEDRGQRAEGNHNYLDKQDKENQGRIWLGLSDSTRSLRPYPSLASIWEMVARTAFTQLNYSPWLLLGTVIGMILIYIVPPVSVILGLLTGNELVAIAKRCCLPQIASLLTWLLMTYAYLPTIRYYRCSPWLAFCLPAIAFLYTVMTLDSALRHWRGQGGAWKGRVYQLKREGQNSRNFIREM